MCDVSPRRWICGARERLIEPMEKVSGGRFVPPWLTSTGVCDQFLEIFFVRLSGVRFSKFCFLHCVKSH